MHIEKEADPSGAAGRPRRLCLVSMWPAAVLLCMGACGTDSSGDVFDVIDAAMPPSRTDAIVEGTRSTSADYPATGVIVYRAEHHGMRSSGMLCSATLIAPDVVIAAGHCDAALLGDTNYPVTFYFSLSLDVSQAHQSLGALPCDAVRITRFLPHPEFSLDHLGTGLRFAKDIALMVLERSIERVTPATLIRLEQADALQHGAEVLIVGYGRRHALTLGTGDMGIKYQGVSHIDEVADFEMQIGRALPGSYKCFGDSGGPTYMQLPETKRDPKSVKLTLVGITSRIYTYGNCGTGGTDTRIDAYLPWIRRTLHETCRTGLRPSCRTHELRRGTE